MSQSSGRDRPGSSSTPPWGVVPWLAGLIVWATWSPFLPREAPWQLALSVPGGPLEIAGNLLMFFPLFFLVGRRAAGPPVERSRVALLGLAAVGACVLVEGGQVLVAGRVVSPADFLLNLSGAIAGLVVGGWVARRSARAARWWDGAFAAALVATYAAVAGVLAARVPAADGGLRLRGWDSSHEVRIADEVGGGRAYRGEVEAARICAGGGEDAVCVSAGAGPEDRRALARAAEESQTVRLEARVLSRTSRQYGPTRIVTFSEGTLSRNATLGQEGDDLVLRLRTPVGGESGSDYVFSLGDAVPTGERAEVEARYREGRVRLVVRAGGTVRSARFRPSTGWTLTWLAVGQVDRGHPRQRIWAAAGWGVLVFLPLGLASGWWFGPGRLPAAGTAAFGAGAGAFSLITLASGLPFQPWLTAAAGVAAAIAAPPGAGGGASGTRPAS